MHACIFGTPSLLTQAGLRLVQSMVETAIGPYEWIVVGTAEELQAAWTKRSRDDIVLFADIPDARITALVSESQIPIIVFLEPPAAIARAVASQRNIKGLDAIRFASQSLATLHELALSANCMLVTPIHAQVPLVDLIPHLATHYRIPLTEQHVAQVLERMSAPSPASLSLTLADLEPSMPQQDPGASAEIEKFATLASEVLHGYQELLQRSAAMHFLWPRSVFLSDQPSGTALTGPTSLVGGARCFAYGPYFHLPAGTWTARTVFTIDDNVSGNGLKIDVFTDKVIFEGVTDLPKTGTFKSEFTFLIEEPRLPVQLRYFNESGAIEGRFNLHGVEIVRTVEAPRSEP